MVFTEKMDLWWPRTHHIGKSPMTELVLAWQINGDFIFDPALITEVEIQFIAEAPDLTRVKFEHKNLDRLGGGGKTPEMMDQGWGMILDLYKKSITH